MRISPEERTAFAHMANRWWGGPDPGEEVVVQLRFHRPTHRTDEEVFELFATLFEHLDGGYGWSGAVLSEEVRG